MSNEKLIPPSTTELFAKSDYNLISQIPDVTKIHSFIRFIREDIKVKSGKG